MKIAILKFGGTSVSQRSVRALAIGHIEEALADGYAPVVVVSAMGRSGEPYATDTLLGLIDPSDIVTDRDKDLLMACGETISAVVFGAMLRGRGRAVTVLSGAQASIRTTAQHGDARIAEIDPARILSEIEQGRVVVVTGFQGVTPEGETTTLGRGGSDTTATALGVALEAAYIDIFTDVDGIMTADPRIVESAARLEHVTYTEMCNFAYQGAKVIHPRAVELAMQKNIPIRVRHTASKSLGTLVTSAAAGLEARPTGDRILTGVAHTADLTQIRVKSGAAVGGFQARIFEKMAERGISVDFFNVTPHDVAFTVPRSRAAEAISAIHALDAALDVQETAGVAKVAAIGAGIHGVPGVLARIVSALAAQGIEILQSADSNTTIWCLVHEADMAPAVRAIHDAFRLQDERG
ncbi:MAG: aspartate kinase [Firmicutes bacterium]|nr:aspartate kinase [Bacillota bacterium]